MSEIKATTETNLSKVFASGAFAVTGELGPPKGADPAVIREKAKLFIEENEEVVDRYLTGHGDLHLMDMRELFPDLPEGIFTDRGELRLWPHRHRCDGFYAALLEKMENRK